MPRVAILVPAHNNATTLPAVLNGIKKNLKDERVSVLVYNDGSTDATEKKLKDFHCRWLPGYNENEMLSLDFVNYPENCGVGVTTQRGIEEFWELTTHGHRFDLFIKIDGDGQHDPRLLPEIITKLRAGADLVIASRFHRNSRQRNTPLDRLLLNRVFAGIIREITGWRISDARSGFMGMRWEHAQAIADQIITERYGIPMEIILRLWKMKPNAKISEIPHPALYGGDSLTKKHRERYQVGGETTKQKAKRASEAYTAMLRVLEDMRINTKQLMSR